MEQRGGAYERGGGSGSTSGNVMQRMFRRSTSQRESLVVEDYNLATGGRRGMMQPRIDTGSWTQKCKNANETHIKKTDRPILLYNVRLFYFRDKGYNPKV